jgi:hypothetical protein
MSLGLRHKKNRAFVYNSMSDGLSGKVMGFEPLTDKRVPGCATGCSLPASSVAASARARRAWRNLAA